MEWKLKALDREPYDGNADWTLRNGIECRKDGIQEILQVNQGVTIKLDIRTILAKFKGSDKILVGPFHV